MTDQFPYKQTWRPVSLQPATTMRATRVMDRLNRVLVVDTFSIPVIVWPGSSYIAANLSIDATLTQSFAFRLPIRIPKVTGFAQANFCPAISWVVDGVRLRYKLWEDVGEHLTSPLYAGEVIPVGAIIEIWTTESADTVTLETQWRPCISLLDLPSDATKTEGTAYPTTLCSIFLKNYPPVALSEYFTTCNPNA